MKLISHLLLLINLCFLSQSYSDPIIPIGCDYYEGLYLDNSNSRAEPLIIGGYDRKLDLNYMIVHNPGVGEYLHYENGETILRTTEIIQRQQPTTIPSQYEDLLTKHNVKAAPTEFFRIYHEIRLRALFPEKYPDSDLLEYLSEELQRTFIRYADLLEANLDDFLNDHMCHPVEINQMYQDFRGYRETILTNINARPHRTEAAGASSSSSGASAAAVSTPNKITLSYPPVAKAVVSVRIDPVVAHEQIINIRRLPHQPQIGLGLLFEMGHGVSGGLAAPAVLPFPSRRAGQEPPSSASSPQSQALAEAQAAGSPGTAWAKAFGQTVSAAAPLPSASTGKRLRNTIREDEPTAPLPPHLNKKSDLF